LYTSQKNVRPKSWIWLWLLFNFTFIAVAYCGVV